MATLKIYKVETNLFRHEPSDRNNWFVSSFYCKVDGNYFQVVESGGSKRGEYLFSDVEVYDIGGSAETFATPQLLMQRLKAIGYTGFFREGEATPPPLADLEDVSITGVTNGQVLKYNDSTSQWENANESGGGGGGYIELIHKQTTDQSLVSLSASIVTLYSYLIPANTYAVGDVVRLRAISKKSGTTAGYITRITVGTNNNPATDAVLGITNTSTNNRLVGLLDRSFIVKDTYTEHLRNDVNVGYDFALANNLSLSQTIIDWTVDNYIILSATGNASDSAQCVYFELTKQ